ncbi:hypothetical protein NUU61_006334 [Penicillium alfredii]|uniref:Uncharacterized protein n=1 Tax=Penicillium alfredii TaxID=1506179 RepID=A0A9W9F0S5_9EURO|nr:uncharacterized protein NUU61_006334 [Penicillium alfredii]KAJ5091464.1 hypothetical protein NUU61_006334 [Penicillium alfredii]
MAQSNSHTRTQDIQEDLPTRHHAEEVLASLHGLLTTIYNDCDHHSDTSQDQTVDHMAGAYSRPTTERMDTGPAHQDTSKDARHPQAPSPQHPNQPASTPYPPVQVWHTVASTHRGTDDPSRCGLMTGRVSTIDLTDNPHERAP